ncbi:hypothetical protein Hamer_G028581 [Homarus americanus]|uniref:Uncharacterized protein n=1 Tax=Homarus americanus TaxID=6706 RepID=A0A8J5JJI7_HOMAM|nr:hypothetical protein Hamer_G030441 [Homarus americanus]KAG7159399.1 hypothetical protein Hamer_G027311 [Homarus americanus]KAG7159662.1 hypothetical protein Hamer_G028581 [Homarus americanus]
MRSGECIRRENNAATRVEYSYATLGHVRFHLLKLGGFVWVAWDPEGIGRRSRPAVAVREIGRTGFHVAETKERHLPAEPQPAIKGTLGFDAHGPSARLLRRNKSSRLKSPLLPGTETEASLDRVSGGVGFGPRPLAVIVEGIVRNAVRRDVSSKFRSGLLVAGRAGGRRYDVPGGVVVVVVGHPTGVRNVIFVRTGDSTDPGRGRRSNRGCGGARRYESETARTVGARERSGRRHSGTEDEDARRLRTKTPVDARGRCSGTREERHTPECGKTLVNAEGDTHQCRAGAIVLKTI